MSRDIDLNINLNKDAAKAAAEQLRTDVKNVGAGMVADAAAAEKQELSLVAQAERDKLAVVTGAGEREKQLGVSSLAEEKSRLAVGTQEFKRVHAERANVAALSLDKIRSHTAEAAGSMAKETRLATAGMAAGFTDMATKGMSSLASLGLGAMGLTAGLGAVSKALSVIGDGFADVAAKQKMFGDRVNEQLEPRANVAALLGVKQDRKFNLGQAELQVRTLQTEAEAVRGQKAYLDMGMQYIGPGKNISKEEADKAYEASARYSIRRGMSDVAPASMLTAQTLGTADFNKPGGGLEASVKSQKLMAILGAGSGDETHLAGELAKTRAGLGQRGDPLFGVVNDRDAATLTSLLAEVTPGQESESARAVIKSLRDFGDKETGPFLKAAGVSPQDQLFDALVKVKARLESEAKRRGGGIKAQDIAREVFPLIQASNAISGLSSKLDQVPNRYAVADSVTAESVRRDERAFPGTARGAARQDAARRALDSEKRGQEQSLVEIQRGQARTSLQESHQWDTPATAATDRAQSFFSLGMAEGPRNREVREQFNKLLGMMPDDLKRKWEGSFHGGVKFTDVGANDQFREMNRDLSSRGINPLTGQKAAPGSDEERELKEQSRPIDFKAPDISPVSMNRPGLPDVFPDEAPAGPQLAATEGKIPGFGVQSFLTASVLGAMPTAPKPDQWEDDDASDVTKDNFLDWQRDPNAEKSERAAKHLAFLQGRKRGPKADRGFDSIPPEKPGLSPLARLFGAMMPAPEPLGPAHELGRQHRAMLDDVARADYGEQGRELGRVDLAGEADTHKWLRDHPVETPDLAELPKPDRPELALPERAEAPAWDPLGVGALVTRAGEPGWEDDDADDVTKADPFKTANGMDLTPKAPKVAFRPTAEVQRFPNARPRALMPVELAGEPDDDVQRFPNAGRKPMPLEEQWGAEAKAGGGDPFVQKFPGGGRALMPIEREWAKHDAVPFAPVAATATAEPAGGAEAGADPTVPLLTAMLAALTTIASNSKGGPAVQGPRPIESPAVPNMTPKRLRR